MEELTKSQKIFLKMRKLFPEDPDLIRAKSEMKKREEDKMRQLFVKRHKDTVSNMDLLAKARASRSIKAKTKADSV